MNKPILFFGWILSVTFFGLGIVLPLFHTKKQVWLFVLESQNFSLLDSVSYFITQQNYFLAFIIVLFTIFFPIVKYFLLLNKFFYILEKSIKTTKLMSLFDKWSMLDVFLVALLLLVFKMDSQLVVVKLKIGTFFLAMSVVSRIFISNLNQKIIIDGD